MLRRRASISLRVQLSFAGGSVNLDTVDVSLDVLCYVPRNTPLTEVVAEILRPALSAQLQVMPPTIGLHAASCPRL